MIECFGCCKLVRYEEGKIYGSCFVYYSGKIFKSNLFLKWSKMLL